MSKHIEGAACVNGHGTARYRNGRCVTCQKTQASRWAKNNADRRATNMRLWKGLPKPTRPEPLCCEICGGSPQGRFKRLALDHDHSTGRFRGWLCHACNMGIGKLGDTRAAMLRVLKYFDGELN